MEYKTDIQEWEKELRTDPIATLLRENRPLPTAKSRARVRRTLNRIETSPLAHICVFARRSPLAFAAACLILVVLTVGTAYAVSGWIHRGDYDPGSYLTTPADQRNDASSVPEVEQVVRDAAPQSEGYRIVMLPELEDADALNDWRVKTGQPAYSEADWAWVREIRPEVQEVLYDGTTFAYTVRLHTDRAAAFSRDLHGEQWLDAFTERTLYAETGEAIGTVYGDSGLVDDTLDETGVTLHCTYSLSEPLHDGRISVIAEISVMDANVDDMAHVGLLGTICYTFSFDADGALKAASAELNKTERRLSGTAVLTQDYDSMWNQRVNLDGVVLEETVDFRSTGLYLSYRIKQAPADWTEKMKESLLSPTNEAGKFEGLSVSYTLGGDGTVYETSFPELMKQEDGSFAYTVILPFFPSDYEQLKQQGVTVHLTLHAVDTFNDVPVGDTWSLSAFPEDGWDITTNYQPLISFTLDLP